MIEGQGNIEIAVAIGRIEEMLKAMDSKLDKLEDTTERHWKKIAELETKLALIEQRQGPRLHIVTWIIGIIAVIGFVMAIADRIYISQGGL